MSWDIQTSNIWEVKLKRSRKDYPGETIQMLNNLDQYMDGLNSGLNPLTYHPGFLHKESAGSKAIDASGMRKPAQTRLYLYPETTRSLVHLITVGDKTSQTKDNEDCREYVAGITGK